MSTPEPFEALSELAVGRISSVQLPNEQFALEAALNHLGSGASAEEVTAMAQEYYLFLMAPKGPAILEPGVAEAGLLAAATPDTMPAPEDLGAVELENGLPVGSAPVEGVWGTPGHEQDPPAESAESPESPEAADEREVPELAEDEPAE